MKGSGASQRVSIDSTPQGASVTVDGVDQGVTPTLVTVERKKDHAVRIVLAGYQAHEQQLRSGLNNWFWGNFLFLGLFPIGMGVEAIPVEGPLAAAGLAPITEPVWPGGAVAAGAGGYLISHAADTAVTATARLLAAKKDVYWLAGSAPDGAAGSRHRARRTGPPGSDVIFSSPGEPRSGDRGQE